MAVAVRRQISAPDVKGQPVAHHLGVPICPVPPSRVAPARDPVRVAGGLPAHRSPEVGWFRLRRTIAGLTICALGNGSGSKPVLVCLEWAGPFQSRFPALRCREQARQNQRTPFTRTLPCLLAGGIRKQGDRKALEGKPSPRSGPVARCSSSLARTLSAHKRCSRRWLEVRWPKL